MKYWDDFKSGKWKENIDVRNFIQINYTPYNGGGNFLAKVSNRTEKLWNKAENLIEDEIITGKIDIDK